MQSIQEKDLRVELETITADSRKVDRLSFQSSYLFSLSLSSDSQFFFLHSQMDWKSNES